ncbi:right-handed parallel beta-helix repeat-containing protein, partial [candidate division WOR-3 bacterium]|nr:right-handed parallel beta-helix repeat-containing protein [candidate division WOR-3 bacterium]
MATKYAQQDGNWSDDIADTTWFDAESGGNAVDHPDEGDNAIINAGVTITIDDAADATIIAGGDTGNAIDVKGILQYLSTAGVDHILQCKGHLKTTLGGLLQVGTVANPIPAARTFTIKLNYSDTPAEGKYGLLNYGEMILQGDPARITVTKCMLNADAAVNATSLTTDVATGWKDNDDIAIASTTRTWSQAENGKMNGDAVGTALTIDGFGGAGGGLAYAHDGQSPIQAEIINLTRNIKITSHTPASYRGYVCCYSGSTPDVDYVEFYMLGYNTTYKHGVEIRTTAVDATNFAYCSVWGKAASNSPFYLDSQNAVIDNCAIYNTDEEFRITYQNNYVTNNTLIKINDYGFYFINFQQTFTGNSISSCKSYGIYAYITQTPVDFSNITVHSCNVIGIYIRGSFSLTATLEHLTLWRNNHAGLYLYDCSLIDVNYITAFGNNYTNISIKGATFKIKEALLNGDSSYATPYGIQIQQINPNCYLEHSELSVVSGIKIAHSTSDLYFVSDAYADVIIKNTKLSCSTKVSNINNAIFGSRAQCEDLDQIQYNDKAWYKYGIVVRDNSTFKTGSYSMRFDQLWAADDWLEYEVEIPVKDAESVVVSAWLRKNASYTSANRPKIKLSGMGITETEDQMSDVTDTWEKVTVSGTPTRTGLAKLTLMTYLTNAGASAWCDFEKTGLTMPVLNTLEGGFWADGHIAQILFDTGSITAAEFWKMLTADIDKAGSFGNLFKDYIDAAITTRASHSAADVDTQLTGSHGAGSWAGDTKEQIRTEMEGAGTKLTLVKTQTDKMNFTGTDIKATLDGEKVALSDATETQIDDIENATIIARATINDATPSTTKFITTLTETDNTFWPRAALLMTSGQNKGQIRGIKTYNGSTKEIQIQTPLSYTPANGDAFWILPARKFLTPDIVEFREEMDANSTKLAFLAAIEGGRWKIISNQMIFYKEDNVTEVARFNL